MFFLTHMAGANLILGIIPESVEILIFGVLLIGLPVVLRWILRKGEVKSGESRAAAKS